MCLILFAHRVHPRYPLIVVANRDEYYQRPTESARFWPEYPELLAGRDLEAGGTWLGLTRGGRFAAITNYREGEPSDAQHSRGDLTLDYLVSEQSATDYLQQLEPRSHRYRGFNLLLGQPGALHYFSNRVATPQALVDGIYALGNGSLHDDWYKMYQGKRDLAQSIEGNPEPMALLEMMSDEFRPADDQLPDTGVGQDMERLLAARFIRSGNYGTRATTILLVDTVGRVSFVEQNYTASGAKDSPRHFDFTLGS